MVHGAVRVPRGKGRQRKGEREGDRGGEGRKSRGERVRERSGEEERRTGKEEEKRETRRTERQRAVLLSLEKGYRLPGNGASPGSPPGQQCPRRGALCVTSLCVYPAVNPGHGLHVSEPQFPHLERGTELYLKGYGKESRGPSV